MEISIRTMNPEEQTFSYTQDAEVLKQSGCIGHLRVDMDTNGFGFYSSWDDHTEALKTPEFKAEFDTVVNALRSDPQYGGMLKNRKSLSTYCYNHFQSGFENGREFGFRADTEHYSYMLRLNPNRGEYAAYIYAYDRKLLDRVLNPETSRDQLYAQFEAQLAEYKSYLLTQPPEEILNHAYDYSIRQTILLSVEDGSISEQQAAALLRSGVTLDDIAKSYSKVETHEVDTISDILESTGNEILRSEFVEQRRPLYLQSAEYAREHGELDRYRASNKANLECADAITEAINDNYSANCLNTDAAYAAVSQRYSAERIGYVLASTIREADWDLRYSRSNKVWAATVPMSDDVDDRGRQRHPARVSAHPGLVDLFADKFRSVLRQQEKAAQPAPMPQITTPKKEGSVEL